MFTKAIEEREQNMPSKSEIIDQAMAIGC